MILTFFGQDRLRSQLSVKEEVLLVDHNSVILYRLNYHQDDSEELGEIRGYSCNTKLDVSREADPLIKSITEDVDAGMEGFLSFVPQYTVDIMGEQGRVTFAMFYISEFMEIYPVGYMNGVEWRGRMGSVHANLQKS